MLQKIRFLYTFALLAKVAAVGNLTCNPMQIYLRINPIELM